MKRMTHVIIFLIFIAGALHSPSADAAEGVPQAPDVQAEAAVLMEAQSGQILFSKNADAPMYPASITKILTGIIAIESNQLHDTVTVSENAVNAGGTRVYLEEGEQKALLDLVYGMLVNSGNDAAVAIAEHLSGSAERFADVMNEKAKQLGASDSHFTNPSGMPDERHVTTAHDMAVIARYAMQNDTFREIVGTKEYPWEGKGWQPGVIENHNRLLWDYEGATGVKNGYTEAAGQTFVAASERHGQQMIAVALKAPSPPKHIYSDLRAMMDYGYKAFETHRIPMETSALDGIVIDGEAAKARFDEPVHFVTLPKGIPPQSLGQKRVMDKGASLPIREGEKLGDIYLMYGDDVIKKIPFSAATASGRASVPEEPAQSAGFPWLTWLISVSITAWCLVYVRKKHLKRKRQRARLRAYRQYRG